MSDLKPLIEVVKRGNYVVLDTETTGLYEDAQIVQIAVIDPDGKVLLDSLVHPTYPIPPDATAVHGITDDMVADAPFWPPILEKLRQVVEGKDVIIYNADYDTRMIVQTCGEHTALLPVTILRPPIFQSLTCAMLAYAEYHGDWNDFHGNYKWQRLESACRQQKLPVINAHMALGDCQMTLALIKHLAAIIEEKTSE